MLSCSFPPALPEGGCIALISPSRWADEASIKLYKEVFEGKGYKVKVSDQSYLKDGILAGSDKARAEALMAAFSDPDVDAVFCIRGGTGANLLLEHLSLDSMAANPKPFVGFSDITVLLNAIAAQTGMVTFHGPMAWNFMQERRSQKVEDALFAMIGGAGQEKAFTMSGLDVVREGCAEGTLVGGNIALFETLIGTRYDWGPLDAIIFIEEVGEPLYKIERMIAHLSQAGKFDGARAILIGEMTDVVDWQEGGNPADHDVYGRELKDFILKRIPADIPVVFNVPCGHGSELMTFPIGAHVRVDLKDDQCEMVAL